MLLFILFKTVLISFLSSASFSYGREIILVHKKCVDFIKSCNELFEKSRSGRESDDTLKAETAKIIKDYLPDKWNKNGVYLPQKDNPKVCNEILIVSNVFFNM